MKELVKVNVALATPELPILEHLMQWACTKDKAENMSVETLQTIVSPFLYEPANEADSYETAKDIECIHREKLSVLSMYLKKLVVKGRTTQLALETDPKHAHVWAQSSTVDVNTSYSRREIMM